MLIPKDAYILFAGAGEEQKLMVPLGTPAAAGWQTSCREILEGITWMALVPKRPYAGKIPPVRVEIPVGAHYVFYIRTMGVLGHPTLPDGDLRCFFNLGWRTKEMQQIIEVSEDGSVKLCEGQKDVPDGSNS